MEEFKFLTPTQVDHDEFENWVNCKQKVLTEGGSRGIIVGVTEKGSFIVKVLGHDLITNSIRLIT